MTPTPSNLVFRFINPQGRLTIATLIAIAVYVLTFRLETGLRISLAYDVSVASFLALHAYRINRITARTSGTITRIGSRVTRFVIITAVLFSVLSLAGVGFMADISKNWTPLHQNIHTASSLLAIVLSWILLHVFYAFYYAHRYYDVDEDDPAQPVRKGLSFPTTSRPITGIFSTTRSRSPCATRPRM